MKFGRLDCGLQYAVKRTGAAAAYCALSIKCGTRDEAGYNSGLAHFTEHTIFKGTKKKSASVINGYLDRLGGELNAFTTKEEIVIHATVLKEDLPKAANLLFELATSATFPDMEVNVEKGVVIDEINSYKDSPADDIYDKFEEMLFSGHPLASPILGTSSSVKKIRREELLEFVKEKFIPQKMAFSIVADIDESRMEKFAEKLAAKWFPDSVPASSDMAENGSPAGMAVPRMNLCKPDAVKFDKTVNKKNHQVNCIIGNLGPSLYEESDRIATVLLCNILGGPASNSILNYELREKNGWVYGVECTYTQYSDSGIVAVSLGCDKENLEKCTGAISAEIRKLQTRPMKPARLTAAKKQFLGQMAISSDNGETQCLAMGKSLLAYGCVISDESTREKIESVTAEQIMTAAQKIFDEDSLCRLVFL